MSWWMWKKRESKKQGPQQKQDPPQDPQRDPQQVMIKILEEIKESLNTMNTKLDTTNTKLDEMNTKLTNKLDEINTNLGTKLDTILKEITQEIRKIPNRIVDELYGNQTVRWGQLVLTAYLEKSGYTPAEISPEEKEIKSQITKTKNGKKKIDEVLIYEKDGEKYCFLIEGKHTLNGDNVEKAVSQMKEVLDEVKDKLEGEKVPVFVFFAKSDTKEIDEHIKVIKDELNSTRFILVLPDGEVREVK